jgi:cell division transport system permease protein
MKPLVAKSKLGSFPTTNVLFTTMLALFIIGLLGLLLLHATRLINVIQENLTVQVYLQKDISESEMIRINHMLGKQDFILKKQGVAQIRFLPKEEAAQSFIQETGENFLQILNDNPLRDAYVIHIDPKYQGQEELQAIKQFIESIHGVFEVDYMENLAASIHKNVTRLGLLLSGFAFTMLLIVVILINNTIKLAIYSQRFLLRSMDLVGATASFIRKPFLARAVVIGFLAGTIGNVLLLSLLHYLNSQITSLLQLQQPVKIFTLLGILPILGSGITFLSTYQATNKYLRISLDDLY